MPHRKAVFDLFCSDCGYEIENCWHTPTIKPDKPEGNSLAVNLSSPLSFLVVSAAMLPLHTFSVKRTVCYCYLGNCS